MLTFFRTNQQYLNALLFFYLAVMRASTFVHQEGAMPQEHGILCKWIYESLPPLSIGASVLAFLLVFVQACLINWTVARYRVATEISLLPGVFYGLITSILPDFLPLSSILLANTFVILAIYNLFGAYKSNHIAGYIFDAGLCLGAASLFHFPFSFLCFWGIAGIGILRGFRFKEVLMLLIGFCALLVLAVAYCFWTDSMSALSEHFTKNIGLISFIRYQSSTVYIKLSVICLLLVLVLMASPQFFSRRDMAAQKYIGLLYWLLLVLVLTIFTQNRIDLNQLLVFSVPLSILLSMTFQRITQSMAEVLHALLIIIALILQFEYLLV